MRVATAMLTLTFFMLSSCAKDVTPLSAVATEGLPEGMADLAGVLEPIRREYKMPGLAAAVIRDGKIVALGAVGERKVGSGVTVTVDDAFHLGSCTKAMTATQIALLVERGELQWDTPLPEALPALAAVMHDGYTTATVRQLLDHRGGLPQESAPPDMSLRLVHELAGTPRAQRLTYAKAMLRAAPAYTPGTQFVYSNAGYVLLGVIIEERSGKDWEESIQNELFGPLGMTTAGFGAMGTSGSIDQPWQHRPTLLGLTPVPPGPRSDNPVALGPAGRVHCSIGDWAKFVAVHVLDGSPLIQPDTAAALHRPAPNSEYAGGWIVTQRDWAGGVALTHAGSNTMNFAVAWLAPKKGFAVLVATNRAGGGVEKGCDAVAAALIQEWLSDEKLEADQ